MNRKLLSVILALVMVLGVFTPVFAEEAKTETTEAPAAPAVEKHIEFLQEQKIIQGDKSGDLMLTQNIDRASFAAILVRAAGKEATAESVKTLPGRFKDMTAAHWANGYATVAHDNNYMKGNPAGEFMPGKEISYAEIATTLVRFLGKEEAGYVYPTSYIARASELGLFVGVEQIQDKYNTSANRNDVFKMLYNALSKEDFGKYNVYKTIVLENDRVAQLKADEVKVEVISVVQVANAVRQGSVAKVGQQFVLNLKDVKVEGGKADTENLFGKVIDVTLDENDKLVKAVVDTKNYDYVWGGLKVSKDGKEVWVAGKKYSARVDERYYTNTARKDRDDRVYRTYLTSEYNNKFRNNFAENFNYEDFASKNYDDKMLFARVTVKDGMVLFVDAYRLTDIAPIKEVARDGQDIFYYNDARDAAVDRLYINGDRDRVIGFNAKDGFFNMDKKDIKAEDTIHWMTGFYLVRTDADVNAKLKTTYYNEDGEFITLEAGEKETRHFLNSKADRKNPPRISVYAYDDNHYFVTPNRGALQDMIGSDVRVLLDVFNAVQSITSHETYSHRLGLVANTISAKGMKFYAPNLVKDDEKIFTLLDGWNTKYYKDKVAGTNEVRYAGFVGLDLVHTEEGKDKEAKLVAVIDGYNYKTDASSFAGYYNGKEVAQPNGKFSGYDWAKAEFVSDRRNMLKVNGREVRYSDNTDVFVINMNKEGNRVSVVPNVDINKVKEYNKKNDKLGAVVLTEKEYNEFLKGKEFAIYNRYGYARESYARAIVFTNYNGPEVELEDIQYGVVQQINEYSNSVDVRTVEGNYVTVEIHDKSVLKFKDDVVPGEWVAFNIVKGTEGKKGVFQFVLRTNPDPSKSWQKPWTEYSDELAYVRAAMPEVVVTGSTITINGKPFEYDHVTKVVGNARGSKFVYVYAPNNKLADIIVYSNYRLPKHNEKPATKDNLTMLIEEAEGLVAGATEDKAKALKAAIAQGKDAKTAVDKLLAESALEKAIKEAKKEKAEAAKAVLEAAKEALNAEKRTVDALVEDNAGNKVLIVAKVGAEATKEEKQKAVDAAKAAIKKAKATLESEGKKVATLKATVGENEQEYTAAKESVDNLDTSIKVVEEAIKAAK